jgi:transcriptional regulator with XRE-family HTH domain
MDLAAYRLSLGLTQEQAAAAIGLKSKGYFSRLERGLEPVPLRLALKIQSWSGGKVTAVTLRPQDADLLNAGGAGAPA